MMQSVHILVFGKVQGVGFRYAARKRALAAGMSGWVMNCTDGSVAICITGSPEEIREYIDWCRHGPAWALVTRVVTKEVSVAESGSFEIRYE